MRGISGGFGEEYKGISAPADERPDRSGYVAVPKGTICFSWREAECVLRRRTRSVLSYVRHA